MLWEFHKALWKRELLLWKRDLGVMEIPLLFQKQQFDFHNTHIPRGDGVPVRALLLHLQCC